MWQFIQQELLMILSAGSGYAVWLLQQNHSMKKKLKQKDEEINKQQDTKIGLLVAASVTTLRIQIIDYHDKYMARGSMPLYAKDNMIEMYKAYHAMGGNGAMTKFYNDLMALPEK